MTDKTTETKTTETKETRLTEVYIVTQKYMNTYNIIGVFATRTQLSKVFPNLKGRDTDCDRNGNGLIITKEKLQ